jgi:hypothetical protein
VVAQEANATPSNKEGSLFSLEKGEKKSQPFIGKVIQSTFREIQEKNDWVGIQIYGGETCERND